MANRMTANIGMLGTHSPLQIAHKIGLESLQ